MESAHTEKSLEAKALGVEAYFVYHTKDSLTLTRLRDFKTETFTPTEFIAIIETLAKKHKCKP